MSRRGSTLLALGAALGVVLAAAGLLASGRESSSGIPSDAVARVNGTTIRMADYERTLSALAGDRREGLSADDRRRALDRLVDEELLVQRGLELDLARRDVRVRRDLTAAVVDAVVAGHEDAEPDAAALAAFYAAHRDFFARPTHAGASGLVPCGAERRRRARRRPCAGGGGAAPRG
jgi:hypothetical protein